MTTPAEERTLPELLQSAADAASDLAPPERLDGDGLVWRAGGHAFVVVQGGRAEFRLDVPIVAAALRTPDTAASDRGPDWVAFEPATLDGHAADRATAWFHAAVRRATR